MATIKSFSIEEKAKAYDEIIKKANKMHHENCEACQACIEELIPELAETEDERIRKLIIKHFKEIANSNEQSWISLDIPYILAWLEKQVEQKHVVIPKFRIGDIIRWKKADSVEYTIKEINDKGYINTADGIMDISQTDIEFELVEQKPAEPEKDEESGFMEKVNRIVDFLKNDPYEQKLTEEIDSWFVDKDKEQQKPADKIEPKFNVGQTIKKEGFNSGFTIVKIEDGFYYNDMGDYFPFTDQDNWELVEHNLADKVEPKFHEGDFILNGDVTDDGKPEIFRVLKVCDTWYDVENIYDSRHTIIAFKQEYSCRVWNTIQDAKDGDVLVDDFGNICIYQEPSTKLMYHSYCYGNHKCFIDMGGSHKIVGTCPATKEQRDQLEKAMADAGYTFDFDKKELRKIEQKPADKVDQHSLPVSDDSSLPTFDESIYHPCTGVYEQKPAWSEEDESLCRQIESILSVCRTKRLLSFDLYKKMLDLLKSLKERVQPKQEWSDKDEKMIHHIENAIKYDKSKTYLNSKGIEIINVCNWLKSLRPQPQWKPSDEQMDALQYIYRNLNPPLSDKLGWNSLKTLELLYNDLKKLREESL